VARSIATWSPAELPLAALRASLSLFTIDSSSGTGWGRTCCRTSSQPVSTLKEVDQPFHEARRGAAVYHVMIEG
jgi:hypothetical protein